jgi:hypothetical protein
MAPLLGERRSKVPKLRRKIVMNKEHLHFASFDEPILHHAWRAFK